VATPQTRHFPPKEQDVRNLFFPCNIFQGRRDVGCDICVPNVVKVLLQEFEDVFPEEISSGLPPIREIEHQIDFVPGASIPNRPAYRSNP
jgi:hypothetical protein